ncbi:hypothetical protein D3C80_1550430 [compost metagenome]
MAPFAIDQDGLVVQETGLCELDEGQVEITLDAGSREVHPAKVFAGVRALPRIFAGAGALQVLSRARVVPQFPVLKIELSGLVAA